MKPALLAVCTVAACATLVLYLFRTGHAVDRAGTVEATGTSPPERREAPALLVGGERNLSTVALPAMEPGDGLPAPHDAAQQLTEAKDRIRTLEDALAVAERERDRFRQDLDWCRFPEDTPWGHALRLGELDGFDERTLRSTRSVIEDEFPLLLRPGEAAWIATRCRDEDWPAWSATVAVIRLLGPDRVLRELPGESAARLIESFPEEFER